MIKIGINGAAGKMGKRIAELANEKPDHFKIVHTFDLERSESLLPYTKGEKRLDCDVLIDFSGPDGANGSATAAHLSKKAVVIGSTGLDEESVKKIKAISAGVPVVLSSNMGVGVNVMLALVAEAAKKLSDDFVVNMTEAHHIHKKDAPSGTALMLLDAVAKAKGWDAERTKKEKSRIKSIREGEIVGDHSVLFQSPAETIEIKHHAESRDVFAKGALLAAQFLSKKTKGFYTMKEVLAL